MMSFCLLQNYASFSIWSKIVFVTSLYEVAFRSYGLFSTDMRKQTYLTKIVIYAMVIYTYKCPRSNCFVSHMKLKYILNDSLYSSWSISVDFKLTKPILYELMALLQCLRKQDKRKCLQVLRKIVADDSVVLLLCIMT